METLWQLLICGGMIGYLAFITRFWFLSAKAYDKLVRFEYEKLPDQWIKDGEPTGMLFWKPSTPYKTFLLIRATKGNPGVRMLLYIFYTSKWIKNYPEAYSYLRDLRRNVLWWNLGILIPVLIFILIGLSDNSM